MSESIIMIKGSCDSVASVPETESGFAQSLHMQISAWSFTLTCRLSALSLTQRQSLFTMTSPSFTKTFLELLKSHQEFSEHGVISFFPKNETVVIRDAKETRRDKVISEQEKMLYRAVRVFSKESYLDSVTVCREFVENVEDLMKCLVNVTTNKCFTGPFRVKCGDIAFKERFPRRFKVKMGGSIYEWIGAYLEQSLIQYYLSNEQTKDENLFKEYEELAWLWRELDQAEREAVTLHNR
eukprot:TRINITY_DN3141_c0_g1_i2.p1 TRINITY_DN3141_c0_g1~~TRINITY_DN3141_c0_g1_i2.p1  ORF type:complete len:239 (+),score=35.67 TRINITY_DN3141_c0_g1_i2:60-776(+)